MILRIMQHTLLFAILISAVLSCKKKGPDNEETKPVTPTPELPVTSGVYAVGTSSTSLNPTVKATMWKDGAATILSDQSSAANAIAVNTNNIYVVGSAKFGNSTLACYWKNKAIVQLQDGVGYYSEASAIALSGNDVYIAGFVNKTATTRVAAYWKNGVMVTLSTDDQKAVANGILVLNDNVYVSGFYTNAGGVVIGCYWRNGELFSLSQATVPSGAFGITVDGYQIYIAGFVSRLVNGIREPAGFVWKRDGQYLELQKLASSTQSYANAIAVLDGKIHTAGAAMAGYYQAVYWPSSGGVVQMPGSSSYGNALAVNGDDIYVAGVATEFFGGALDRATIWKNLEISFKATVPSEIKGLVVVK